jgi:pilus assembly protein CpaC
MNRVITALIMMILGAGSSMPAQQPERPATLLPNTPVTLTVGRGELLQFPDETSRVSVSDPTIADAVVVSTHDVVLNGKAPGNTTILIWHGDNVSPYAITVEPDLSEIQKQLRATFPGEQIEVSSSKDSIILMGVVSEADIAKQAVAIAATHAKSVVNMIQSPPADNRQIMLQVKFASVDRTSLANLGANIFSLNPKLNGSATTQQFPFPSLGQLPFTQGPGGPQLGNQTVTVSNLLNIFAFRPDLNIGATLALLQSQNLLQILAEPNLMTLSGHEASFLAGGEFPYPVITNTGTGAQPTPVVTIQFRPFGVRLNFTPTVEPNGLIHLKVKPEVSSLDYSNALTISGFTIPALSSRTAETEVELREGESFAIAGLIDNRVTKQIAKLPGIGDLPIIGNLFRSRSTDKTNTELLVLITPSFVKPFAAGAAPPLPQFPEGFLGNEPSQLPDTAVPSFVGPRGNDPPGAKP